MENVGITCAQFIERHSNIHMSYEVYVQQFLLFNKYESPTQDVIKHNFADAREINYVLIRNKLRQNVQGTSTFKEH